MEAFSACCLLLIVLGSLGSAMGHFPVEPANQVRTIFQGMLGSSAGDRWDEFVNQVDSPTFPRSVTIFFPMDRNRSDIYRQWVSDPSVIGYHIVPRAIPYWQLRVFLRTGARLPTLKPDSSILVTSNGWYGFTINDVPVTHPQIFYNGAVAVHGIPTPLNHTIYGNPTWPEFTPFPTGDGNNAAPHPPPQESGARAGAHLIKRFSIGLLAVCTMLTFS